MGEPLGLSLFPATWIPGAIPPPAFVEIYLNWLNQQLDIMAEQRWPILKQIHGWRRLEVIEYLESIDWTEGILDTKMAI